ncbi:hypothetical protein D3C71_1366840 [compost metagenome]
MFFQIVHADRLEGARAHVQGHVAEIHALVLQRGQQGLIEVQAGGRGGHRADLAREHSLVALAVVHTRLALDVGRQRQPAGMQQPLLQRLGHVELQHIELAIAAQHLGLATGVERDAAARLGRLAGANLRAGLLATEQALDQDLDPAAGGLLPEQTRRDHPRVVEDQQVAGLQQLRQITDMAVIECLRRRRHQQQAAGRTLGQGGLGDQRLGQLVVEIGLLQGRNVLRGAGYCSPRWVFGLKPGWRGLVAEVREA